MRIIPALAAAAVLLAAPAAAVTVTGVSAGSGNLATVATAEFGRLEADFEIRSGSPIRLGLQADEGETGFAFNSVVDIFTASEIGLNVRNLKLVLRGASFGTVGDITPAFSTFTSILGNGNQLLTIRFDRPGEPFGLQLGGFDGGQDFRIDFTPGAGPASLTLLAAVPEPASWAMMILGFLAVGTQLRRQQPAVG